MNHAPQPQNLSPPVVADTDPSETQEWREALLSLATNSGPARVRQVLDELARVARSQRIGWQPRQHSCERIAQSRREGGAEYAVSLNGRFFDLAPSQLDLLTNAMRFHSDGELHNDATIQSCRDADPLRSWAGGQTPAPEVSV